jgi:phospholipid/cholesterol/gamma-HCH transport system substrate-binding protein
LRSVTPALSAILKASSQVEPTNFIEGIALPSHKEIQWSQLRVGALVLAALAVLVLLVLLTSSATGGLFAHKLVLRSYFQNAAGIKAGAPVALEGVTIGNVARIRVVPERNPNPVEVTMRVGEAYMSDIHATSTTSIAQAGVLGDSYVDISSANASGPPPANNAELRAIQAPSIQTVISSSEASIQEITQLMRKTSTLMDSLNSKRGTMGGLINDPAFYAKVNRIADNLQKITSSMSEGHGTLGKLVNDDTLYTNANSLVDRLDRITDGLQQGQGSAGKLLKDDTLYKNLNTTVTNANQLLAEINAGKGALGKLRDPAFAQKLDDTVTHLDSILTSVDEGKGTMGQLLQNRSLYDHTDQTMEQAQQLVKSIRDDPKKYLVIRLKVF